MRLQAPQKAWDTGAMMPISPDAIVEGVAAGGFTGVVGGKGYQRAKLLSFG